MEVKSSNGFALEATSEYRPKTLFTKPQAGRIHRPVVVLGFLNGPVEIPAQLGLRVELRQLDASFKIHECQVHYPNEAMSISDAIEPEFAIAHPPTTFIPVYLLQFFEDKGVEGPASGIVLRRKDDAKYSRLGVLNSILIF